MRIAAPVGAVFFLLLLSACGSGGWHLENPGSSGEADLRSRPITVSVSNENLADARVFVLRGTSLIPIGSVDGFSTRSFTVSAVSSSDGIVQFAVKPLSDRIRRVFSEPVMVRGGELVEWELEADFRVTRIMVHSSG